MGIPYAPRSLLQALAMYTSVSEFVTRSTDFLLASLYDDESARTLLICVLNVDGWKISPIKNTQASHTLYSILKSQKRSIIAGGPS